MPPWWVKSTSKDGKKKGNKESIMDTIHRKFKISSEEKCSSRSAQSQRYCSDTVSENGFLSNAQLRSLSPSTQISRCQSFAESPHPQPLPLPGMRLTNSLIDASTKPGFDKGSKPSFFLPVPVSGNLPSRPVPSDASGDLATASISSDGYIDSDDPSESRLLSPQASDYENGNAITMNCPSSVKLKEQDTVMSNNQAHHTSAKKRTQLPNLQIPVRGAVCSAPDSSMSSPSRSPMRGFGHELVMNCGFWATKPYPDVARLGSGQCSSPGSGVNSGQNSVGGDASGLVIWPHSRCSPEYSPIPSPRMTSPGPSSRTHSAAVTPLHPRAGLAVTDTPVNCPDDKKQQSHPLPLPPITISSSCHFLPSHSAAASPLSRSPGRAETPISPGSRWKKGRLLGRGTFGHVYLGFDSESGEFCAMKEVTLFSDNPKSKESAQQLGQEIALLSRLQHPNIVQYYGSETIDDRLYIYLEYVSGGSINKLLQDYGPLGEIAIRSYTKQILAGLVYLHDKNTVHRDIKGANILVDPSGCVKLADFGMAKHVTGHSCPLSFKGSPYWMAPEVIKHANGCNLAVDVWSLGCTILEMATGKPPWNQYEGVAALFKIGNSKELPATPDHLSDEGKDFVRWCLQRNPLVRPTVAQLLEHPFVKNAATFERSVLNAGLAIGHTKTVSFMDRVGTANHHPRRSKTSSGFSDAHSHVPRNMSCPVSPTRNPLLHSRSPQNMSRVVYNSPPPISSPCTPSGSSTPLHQLKQQTSMHEGMGTIARPQNPLSSGVVASYHDPKPDLFAMNTQTPNVFGELASCENGFLRNQFGLFVQGNTRKPYDGQLVAARISQQLSRDLGELNLNPGSQILGRTQGM